QAVWSGWAWMPRAARNEATAPTRTGTYERIRVIASGFIRRLLDEPAGLGPLLRSRPHRQVHRVRRHRARVRLRLRRLLGQRRGQGGVALLAQPPVQVPPPD